ncbi:restriction endonuclease subunit S, partial [uncultured Helicobacter sp.]
MAELEKTFKQNGGEWKEFRIGDLFISYNGDFDIQKTHLNDRGFYVVSSGEQNMGIIGKTDLEARIFPKNTITCDMFGNVYYRNFDYKMVTHARVFCLEFIAGNLNEKIALFIISAMKFLRFKFQYSNMASWRKIQDLTISLPVYNPARHCEDDRTKRSIEINKMDCHDSATAESRNDN